MRIKPYSINNVQHEDTIATAPAAPTNATALSSGSGGTGIVGEVDTEDIIIPRLNIVQNVGQMAEMFNAGAVVLNKEVELPTPLELTILTARKQFVENLPFDSEEKPRVFDTLAEVKQAGGTIEWEGNVRPSYNPVLHVQVIFAAPEGFADYALPLDYNGHAYGLAIWTLRGVAYNRAGKNILTAARFSLRDGLVFGKWELTTKKEKFGRNSVVVPVLRNAGRNTPDFVNWVKSIGG